MARPDVLLVSLGTTLGWRVADEMLLEQLRRAGASTAVVSVGRGAADRLRRGYPLNDLVEMHAARRTARTAVERHEPRALIVSSTTAAMLLPALPVPYAVRFDSPARLNRPGARNAPLHALERRGMSRARITIPFSVAGAEALPEGAARPIVVSPPIDPSASHDSVERAERETWPWRTCPIRRRRASTCWWPAGRPPRCPTRGSRSTGSTRSGRARTCGEAACRSRRRSTCSGPCRPISSAPACGTRGPTWRPPAGRTGARPRSRRSRTARCSPPFPPAARTRACAWRAGWTRRWWPTRSTRPRSLPQSARPSRCRTSGRAPTATEPPSWCARTARRRCRRR